MAGLCGILFARLHFPGSSYCKIVTDLRRAFLPAYFSRGISGQCFFPHQDFALVREQSDERCQPYIYIYIYIYAGLDLAKVEDYTVLTILDSDCRVVFADRFHRIDWAQQVQRIQAATDRYSSANVFVDSTGAGEPIYESLCRAGVRAKGYAFTQRSKAALIDNLSLLFEQRKIEIPTAKLWPEGIDELESFEYSVTDRGNVRTGAPASYHDDCVIGLALAAWHFRPRPSRKLHSQRIG